MTGAAVQTLSDPLDPARARALQATLGETPSIDQGDGLPLFAHHIYFWDPQPPAALGRDGHPATGALIPDLGLPRRMWAAGELTFHQPLRAGIRAEKTTTVAGVTRKTGRSGPLAFVRLRWKRPDGDVSRLIERAVTDADVLAAPDDEARFAAAVAGFGQLLQGGRYTGDFDYDAAAELARGAKGEDPYGYRAEAVRLMELAASLAE